MFRHSKKTNAILSLMMAFIMMFSGTAPAFAGLMEDSKLKENGFEIDQSGMIINYTGEDKELSIPETVAGIEVKAIKGGTFSKKGITSLSLPEGLERIEGQMAFAGNSLEKVVFPSTIKYIGAGAFILNPNLTEVEFNEGLEHIGKNAFSRTSLKEVILPESLNTLEEQAFSISKIERLVLNEGLDILDRNVFSKNDIKELQVPNSVKSIETSAFADNSINKLEIGSGLEYIHAQAFANNNIDEINLPKGIKQVSINAFQACPLENKFTIVGEFDVSGSLVDVEEYLKENIDFKIHGGSSETNSEYINLKWDKKTEVDYIGSASEDFKNVANEGFNENLRDLEVFIKINKLEEEPSNTEWLEEDFIIEGKTIKGLSKAGEAKAEFNKDLVIPAGIEAIDGPVVEGKGIFEDKGLETLSLASSVKEIGARVFATNNLTEVDISNIDILGVGAFSSNINLKTVKLSPNLKTIESTTFSQCSLEKIDLPQGLEKIGRGAFSNNRLKEVLIPCTVISYSSGIFPRNEGIKVKFEILEDILKEASEIVKKDYKEESVNVFDRAFENAKILSDGGNEKTKFETVRDEVENLRSAIDGLKTISGEIIVDDFKYNPDTKTIVGYVGTSKDIKVPAKLGEYTVEKIGDSVFNSLGITSLEIEDGIKEIGNITFRGNDLKELVLPNSIEKLGSGAFANNKKLEDITLSKSLKEIPQGTFSYSAIREIDIPEGVIKIGDSAFSESQKLTDLKLPTSLVEIDKRAFWNHKLTSLILPENLELIGAQAFIGGTIRDLRLNNKLKEIGKGAFKNNDIQELIIPKHVELVGQGAFEKNSRVLVEYEILEDKVKEAKEFYMENELGDAPNIHDLLTEIEKVEKLGKTPGEPAEFDEVKEKIKMLDDLMVAIENDEVIDYEDDGNYDNVEIVPGEKWESKYFEFEGSTLKGFTGEGLAKFKAQAEPRQIIFPDKTVDGKDIIKIGDKAFEQTKDSEDIIRYIELPENLEEIGKNAFLGNKILSLKLPKSMKKIGDAAFTANRILKFEVNEGLEEIGRRAFLGNRIKKVRIPSSMKSLKFQAFQKNKLEEVYIEDGIEYIGPQVFQNNIIEKVRLPETLKVMDQAAFVYNNLNANTIEFPEGLEIIGPKVFCSNKFDEVTIPRNVKFMGPNSFRKNPGFDNGEFKVNIDGVFEVDKSELEKNEMLAINNVVPLRVVFYKGFVVDETVEERYKTDYKSWEKLSEDGDIVTYKGKFNPIPEDEITCGNGSSCDGTNENLSIISVIVKIKVIGKDSNKNNDGNDLGNNGSAIVPLPKEEIDDREEDEGDINYIDVSENHWAREYIENLTKKNILKGYEDGSFKPEKQMTRAEFANILFKAMDLKIDSSNNSYKDVDESDWYYNPVMTLSKIGIVSGNGLGEFNPMAYITRQEIAKMLSLAIDYKKVDIEYTSYSLEDFIDSKDVSTWAEPYMNEMIKIGLFKGNMQKEIKAKELASRAEVVTLIARLLETIDLRKK